MARTPEEESGQSAAEAPDVMEPEGAQGTERDSDAEEEAELDDALDATFPASDPVSVTIPHGKRRPDRKESLGVEERRKRRESEGPPAQEGQPLVQTGAGVERGAPSEAAILTGEESDDAGSRANTRRILETLFGPPNNRSFAVRLWDGEVDGPEGPVAFTLVLRHPGALRRMLLPPTERSLGEAYVRGDCDIDGDLEAATGLAEPLTEWLSSARAALSLLRRIRALPGGDDALPEHRGGSKLSDQTRIFERSGGRHSLDRDLAAVRYHYDLGNDFYRLWLDRNMVYSCGYFAEGVDDLDEAQEEKLDRICRKLRLEAGERLLDIGCGWGSLLLHAVENYGVDATGITLSTAQADLARERIAAGGYGDRCRVEVRDYRDLPAGRFDKISSVGMVEHVGRKMLPTYFAEVYRLLEPGGLFLNHGIVHLNPDRSVVKRFLKRRTRAWVSFADRHVFPDSELMTPAEALPAAERAGFEMRDVESMREHYALTARHWVRRLETHHAAAVEEVGEPTYRIWRLYLAASAHLFETGRMSVLQTLFARRDARGKVRLPRSRDC